MVRLTRIYTRGGDAGETSLGDGTRVPKHALRVAAYGTVDEANAAIGIARLHADPAADEMLGRIQNDLFDLGADLCTPEEGRRAAGALRITAPQVERLEREIDTINAALRPLDSLILPGGTPAAAHLHLARTVTRRAERLVSELGPPRYRASEMEVGGGRRPARQDKRVERPQRRVYRVDLAFEALDLGRGDAQCSSRASALFRGAQVGAEVEEVVLNAAEHFVCRRIGMQPGDSDRRICFVDGAIGGDAQCVLRDARTVAERGLAGITAARIDPSQSNHLRRKRLRG